MVYNIIGIDEANIETQGTLLYEYLFDIELPYPFAIIYNSDTNSSLC